jgi:hypothetical protein
MNFNSLMKKADKLLITTFNNEGGVTLWPNDARERTINAIVDKPYERTDIPDGGHITTADRSFTATDDDVIDLQKKDEVLADSVMYYVKELQPDGLGVTRVMLTKYKKSAADTPDGRL